MLSVLKMLVKMTDGTDLKMRQMVLQHHFGQRYTIQCPNEQKWDIFLEKKQKKLSDLQNWKEVFE